MPTSVGVDTPGIETNFNFLVAVITSSLVSGETINRAPIASTFLTSLTVLTVPAPTNKSLFFKSFSIILSAPGVVRVISITFTPASTNASAISWPCACVLHLTKVIIFSASNLSTVFINYPLPFE